MILSIVSTLYCSRAYLNEFYLRCKTVAEKISPEFEILLVNDGSPDDSLDLALKLQALDPRISIIDLSRNFGHHRALMCGISKSKGDFVFLIDSDLEEEPEWLISFYERLKATKADVIYGVQENRKGGWWEKFSGHLFYSLFNLFSSIPLVPNPTTARLMTRRYITSLLLHQERELFIFGLLEMTGYKQISSPVVKKDKGKSTYSFRKKFRLFINAITSFSEKPLIFIFYTGSSICLFSIGYISLYLFRALFMGIPVPGWPSLILSIWFLGGLIILFLGIIGIYISKIFIESKHRPFAIVRHLYTSNPKNADLLSQSKEGLFESVP